MPALFTPEDHDDSSTEGGADSDYYAPLNTFFDQSGFDSKVVLLNLGSTAFFIMLFFFMHLSAQILTLAA
jgi:hypothetical protein